MKTPGAAISPHKAMDHQIIHRDPYAYSAHPHVAAAANDNWLLVFTQTRRRAGVIHPPQDPAYVNMLMRSSDEGRSWSPASVVPDFGWSGVECAGLTVLRSGAVLLNQWRFDWHTLAYAEAHLPKDAYNRPEELLGPEAMASELSDWAPQGQSIAAQFPWARAGGQSWGHLSLDGGNTFTASARIETAPFSGGYGMRGAVEVGSTIVLPLSDVPNYQSVFTVRSEDGGKTWSQPSVVAEEEGHAFEEPAPLVLRSGRIIMLLRDNISRILHVVHSMDDGISWSAPVATGIADYPADLAQLDDGRVVCVAGRRRVPYGISLYVSADEGDSWNFDQPVMIRSDLPNRDLGYPSVAQRSDGSLFIAYYAQDREGVTGIHASIYWPDGKIGRKQELSHGER
jgi:hypothetical protein